MTSQRWVDFKKFIRKLWTKILRYHIIIFLFGLIGLVFEIIRPHWVFYLFIWYLSSLGITYILFFIFHKPEKDLDGDF